MTINIGITQSLDGKFFSNMFNISQVERDGVLYYQVSGLDKYFTSEVRAMLDDVFTIDEHAKWLTDFDTEVQIQNEQRGLIVTYDDKRFRVKIINGSLTYDELSN